MAKKVYPSKSQEGRDDETGYQHQIKAKKMDEAESKSGCSKKLFMLLLPFAAVGAVGAYLLIRS